MKYAIFDIEADGLLNTVTKIHCLSYQFLGEDKKSTVNLGEIKEFIEDPNVTLVGHKITGYDIPALNKVLGTKRGTTENVIDTLALSWYLFARRKVHGLEAWGEELGVTKVKIDTSEWAGPLEGESLEEFQSKMIKRCEGDVDINYKLFSGFKSYLDDLYPEGWEHLLGFLNFKMDCLRKYEATGIPFDRRLAEESYYELEFLIEEKITELKKFLPKILEKTRPAKMVKKDGEPTKAGIAWSEEMIRRSLPNNTTILYKDGNPGSPIQIKNWISAFGWKPQIFKPSTSKKPEDKGKMIPQISGDDGICDSVKELYIKEPSIKLLEGLFVLKHRFGVFKSFLENEIEGKLHMGASSFTNTIRLQHTKPLANLPGVRKVWGKEVRGCLIVPDENHTMFGADISGLEDSTKQHYMYFYDKEYVETMLVPGFDGHLDIAVFAGLLIEEEVAFFKYFKNLTEEEKEVATGEEKAEYNRLDSIRSEAKTVNFGGLYGIGPAKLAEKLKIPLERAMKLHKAYWQRNKAVKQIEKDALVKVVRGQKWLFNPVSKMWIYLKEDKDIFSSLNQNTGSYVFTFWLKESMKVLEPLNIIIPFEYHDELMGIGKKNLKEEIKRRLQIAMDRTNEALKLNVKIRFSVDFGNNYAECH